MRYAQSPVRPGLTAIAAVLALSSTPSFAQEAAPVTVTPPPVEATAPTPVPAPSVATPAPAAPVTVQSSAPAAPAASGSLVTVPIRPGGIAPGLNAAPSTSTVVAAPEVETEAAPVARTASTPRSAPVRTTAPAARVAERTAPPAPTAPIASSAPAVEPVAPAAEAPPSPAPRTAQVRTTQVDASDDVLPIAGAAGAAILLIGGGLFAMRRRRHDEDEVYVADTVATRVDPVEPMATFEQTAYVAPVASPVAAMPVARAETIETIDAPTTAVPAGFDTSRFGRHTQAAYRGPTPENPFLSLKRRLKRASFMDQRERMATEATTPTPQAASAPSPQPAQAPRQTEHITTRIKTPPRPGFRPAWQG